MLMRDKIKASDVKLMNCAACDADMLPGTQPIDLLPVGFRSLPILGGHVKARPVCKKCYSVLSFAALGE